MKYDHLLIRMFVWKPYSRNESVIQIIQENISSSCHSVSDELIETPSICVSDLCLPEASLLPGAWPEDVRCEMNLRAWEDALRSASLLGEFRDVLEGFSKGFDQGIPDHRIGDLPYFTPPNHSSAKLAEEDIRASIKLELESGRMFGPFTKEQVSSKLAFFRTSPMGAVINGDGSLRPINDLSFPRKDPSIPSVNSFVDPKQFLTTWDYFKRVAAFF